MSMISLGASSRKALQRDIFSQFMHEKSLSEAAVLGLTNF